MTMKIVWARQIAFAANQLVIELAEPEPDYIGAKELLADILQHAQYLMDKLKNEGVAIE